MLNILKTTVLYFRASEQLDCNDVESMLRKLSGSAWLGEVWPEIPEARRRALVERLVLDFDCQQDLAEASRST
jgi:hypothetical protein